MAPMMAGVLPAAAKGFGSLMSLGASRMDPGRFGAFGTDPSGASNPLKVLSSAGQQAGNFMLRRTGYGFQGDYGQPSMGQSLPYNQQPLAQDQGSNPYMKLRDKWRWEG